MLLKMFSAFSFTGSCSSKFCRKYRNHLTKSARGPFARCTNNNWYKKNKKSFAYNNNYMTNTPCCSALEVYGPRVNLMSKRAISLWQTFRNPCTDKTKIQPCKPMIWACLDPRAMWWCGKPQSGGGLYPPNPKCRMSLGAVKECSI